MRTHPHVRMDCGGLIALMKLGLGAARVVQWMTYVCFQDPDERFYDKPVAGQDQGLDKRLEEIGCSVSEAHLVVHLRIGK